MMMMMAEMEKRKKKWFIKWMCVKILKVKEEILIPESQVGTRLILIYNAILKTGFQQWTVPLPQSVYEVKICCVPV